MMASNKNRHHAAAAAIITLLAFLAPMACHGLSIFSILCAGGWVRPIQNTTLGQLICPPGSSETPLPVPPIGTPIGSSSEPAPPSGAGLYPDYYNSDHSNYSCPNAETIVRNVVEDAIANKTGQGGPGVGAGLIRLHFHDCFVQGCDASVLLNTTASGNPDTEREGAPNKDSLRGFEVIDAAKAALENACPGVVSCADVLAFAARDAARSLSGGRIEYATPGGRWDARESFAGNTSTLPGPFSDLPTLRSFFAAQQLNTTDLVLLSAGHSIGNARCIFISTRSGMNQTFAAGLKQKCQSSPRVNQDYKTSDVLDSQYYNNVFDNKDLFDSDNALTTSTFTNDLVEKYKENSGNKWEEAFGQAMVKMGKINIKTKSDSGFEIRKQCWTYNVPSN